MHILLASVQSHVFVLFEALRPSLVAIGLSVAASTWGLPVDVSLIRFLIKFGIRPQKEIPLGSSGFVSLHVLHRWSLNLVDRVKVNCLTVSVFSYDIIDLFSI